MKQDNDTTVAAAAETATAKTGAGYKLVTRNYEPLIVANKTIFYTPGSDQWIDWPTGDHKQLPPPPPEPCTRFALHYCEHALQTVRYANRMDHMDDLRLLRVSPLRLPGSAATSSLPLFVDANDTFPKRAAHGLHVDAEVTDAAERRALLSGTLRYRDADGLRFVETTVDNGCIVLETHTDALGNVARVSTFRDDGGNLVGGYAWASACYEEEDGMTFFSQTDASGLAYMALQCEARGDDDAETTAVVFGVRDGRYLKYPYRVKARHTAADVVVAVRRFKDEAKAAAASGDLVEAIVHTGIA